MFKVANQVLDFYDDVNYMYAEKLAHIAPNVKIMSPEARSELNDSDFALCFITKKASKLNRFPVHSPDDTWMSNQYFELTHHKLPEKAASVAAYHIKNACAMFDIQPSQMVLKLSKEAESNLCVEDDSSLNKKTPQINIEFEKMAQVDDICSNYTNAQYAFPTAKHVEVGAQYFDKIASQLPIEKRNQYALALQKRANELGLKPLSGTVGKYASDHYNPQLDMHLMGRKILLENRPEFVGALNKLSAARTQLSPQEFAQALSHLDKKAGITGRYGSHIHDPFISSFCTEADYYNSAAYKKASGGMTPEAITAIANAKYDKIKSYFGQSVADELKANPVAIFESLPKDAKEIIGDLADGNL